MAKKMTKKELRQMRANQLQGHEGEFKKKVLRDLDKEIKGLCQKHTNDALASYLACTALTLRDELGLGKARLERIFRAIAVRCADMRDKLITAEDIYLTLYEETKFDLQALIDTMNEERKEKAGAPC